MSALAFTAQAAALYPAALAVLGLGLVWLALWAGRAKGLSPKR